MTAILEDLRERIDDARTDRRYLSVMIDDHRSFSIPMTTEEETVAEVQKALAVFPTGMVFYKNEEAKDTDPVIIQFQPQARKSGAYWYDKGVEDFVGIAFKTRERCPHCDKPYLAGNGLSLHIRTKHKGKRC